jgi:serine/threonine protein phosphatase PrpC
MTSALQIRSASRTDKGNVRQVNEDSCVDLQAKRLWAVADGMGGHKGGDIASGMIADALRSVAREETPSQFLDAVEDAVTAVNERLCDMSAEREPGGVIGSTLALLMAFPRHCVVAWAGDSRVYRQRGAEFLQITFDHSEVEELIARGAITREQAKDHAASNVVTRAVGGARQLFLDVDLVELQAGDRFLVCSDGLYKELADSELSKQLTSGDVDTACQALVDEALRHECRDNVTAVVVEFQSADAAPAEDDEDRTVTLVP